MSREILQDIIDDFQIERFNNFFRVKNRSFAPKKMELGQYDDKSFSNSNKLGEIDFSDEGQQLIVCTFESLKPLSERSGKKAQYEKGKRILKELQADAGMFIFYDKHGNFRFSLIYTNYLGKKRDWSTFRRFTYFVSPNLTNKTFLQQIGDGDFSSIEKIKKVFSVEKVTKDFYKDIANWYFWAVQNSKFPNDAEPKENRRNIAVIRLITRIIFIWFMRERELVPKELFQKKYISEVLRDCSPEQSTYYKAILQNLFFATLSTKQNERKFRSETRGHKGYNPDFGNQYVYRYLELFINPDKIKDYFGEIPFLNGGLFECLDDKQNGNYIDGFTSTKKHQPEVPNFLFFSNEKDVNLNAEYGTRNKKYKVRGLIDTLSTYNFTIDENDPNDAEIALDPELLGKVFENLLASFNPETASTARKATGSYYTPREIVDYMVTQSLKEYLKSHLEDISGLNTKIDQLFDNEKNENPFKDTESKKIVKLIDNLRIVDPAVGSGAFPMGILNRLVFILGKLDPENRLWKEAQTEAVRLSVTDPALKRKLIDQINEQFKNKNFDYGRKLYLIQKCIYGVDIQLIAVEIAKLRFFIALLVDEQIDKSKDNWGVEPLPNLDFKIMQGNSLVSEFLGINFDDEELQNNRGFAFKDDIDDLIDEFQQKKNEYQNEPDGEKKYILRQEIDDLMIGIFVAKLKKQKKDYFTNLKSIEEKAKLILDVAKKEKYINDEKARLSKTYSFDLDKIELQLRDYSSKNKTKPFFAWKLYFAEVFQGDNPGFDIVIANPPYIQLQKLKGNPLQEMYRKQNLEVFDSTGDVYCLFYEKGLNIQRKSGHLCYITSNKWMRTGYGKKLREYFLKYNPKTLIDLGPGAFESATVDTNIIMIEKAANANHIHSVTIKKENSQTPDIDHFLKKNGVNLANLTGDAWFIGNAAEMALKEKIERIGKPLKEWDVNIYRGVLTGLNEAFIIDTETKERLCKEDSKSEEILRPILRGRDIKRYSYDWKGLWVIFIPWHFPLHENSNIEGASKLAEAEFKKQYPAIFCHLIQYKEKLSQRNKAETGIRYEWYALQRCAATYYAEFEKDKVVWKRIGSVLRFGYDEDANYCQDSTCIMTGNDLKYICAFMNSRLGNKLLFDKAPKTGTGDVIVSVQALDPFLVPPISSTNRSIAQDVESIVDNILALTKTDGYSRNQEKQTKFKEYEEQIDQLVYQLYNLTQDEIAIVEGQEQ